MRVCGEADAFRIPRSAERLVSSRKMLNGSLITALITQQRYRIFAMSPKLHDDGE